MCFIIRITKKTQNVQQQRRYLCKCTGIVMHKCIRFFPFFSHCVNTKIYFYHLIKTQAPDRPRNLQQIILKKKKIPDLMSKRRRREKENNQEKFTTNGRIRKTFYLSFKILFHKSFSLNHYHYSLNIKSKLIPNIECFFFSTRNYIPLLFPFI